MQEINLLQNKLKDKTDQFEKNNRMIMVVLTLLLTVVLVATGAFYMLTKSAQDSKAALDQENVQITNRLAQMEGQLKLARGFQAQSKNITTLLDSHVIWSEFMKQLTANTYKSSKYVGLALDTDGKVFVEGKALTYTNIGKLLLGLESIEHVQDVRLLSTSVSADEAESGISFSIDVLIDTSVLTQRQ